MNFDPSFFNAANGGTNIGWLWGTPAVGDITAGINLVFSASNGVSPNASTGTLTFSVVAQPANGPMILSTTLPVATVGTPYSFQLYAQGQPSTFTWAVTSGNKPGWMTVSSSGLITGTPAVGDITNALIMTFSCTSSNGTANTGNMGLKVQAAGGYVLIQPSDFTYVGYYDVQTNGLDSPYTQGLTVRRVGSEVRLIQWDNSPRRFAEISLAGKTPATSGSTTANQITSTTRRWNEGITSAGYQFRDYARIYWDNNTNVLWLVSAVNYPDDTQDVSTNIFTSSLTDGVGQTNVKRYSLDAVPDRRAGTGVVPTPATFQSTYGVGPFVVGLGGYFSRVEQRGQASSGLSAYAIPDPSGYPTNTSFSTAQYKPLAVRAATPINRQLTLVNNEFDSIYNQPNPDGLNYWGYLSRYVGGFFIDGASKKGFVTITTTAKTRSYYYVSSVEAYGYLAEAHVFDPNDLGRISQGIQSSRIDPIAANMKALTETQYTGLVRDQFNSDAAYDDVNKKLYVLMNGRGPTGFWNRIYVYDVNV
jgi:hypothetical protein